MEEIVSYVMDSPVAWVEQANVRLANGDIYSFEGRPYLIKPLMSDARRKCVIKARGLGFSETFILKSLHGCLSGRFKQGAAYYFPDETQMRTFVQSRFNPLLKDNPDNLGKHVKDTDTTYYKRVGKSNLYFDGMRLGLVVGGQQKDSAAIRGKHFDHCVLDESDMMDETIPQKVEGSLTASGIKEIILISNPTVENHKIDRLYKQSNQLHWFRQCTCGEWTCPDEEFPNLISKNGCHCKKCGKVLGFKGEWVSKMSDRGDLYGINATDWEGYSISDLNLPTESPWNILQNFNNPPNGNLEDVYKFSLGRAYTPKENRLTTVEVYDCCGRYPMSDVSDSQTAMGVDVGKERYHYVIGYRVAKDRFEVLKYGCAQSFDDIAVIAMRMQVRNCVVDIRPYEAEARRFQKEMKFRVWLCQYGTNPMQDLSFDEDLKQVKCFRTGVFDITHRLIVEKRVTLPFRNSLTKDFANQYCEPYKVKNEDPRTGSVVYQYDKGNGEDHYRNAMNYFYIAANGLRVVHKEGSNTSKRKKEYNPVAF